MKRFRWVAAGVAGFSVLALASIALGSSGTNHKAAGAVASAAGASKTSASMFADLCNQTTPDFDHPIALSGSVDVQRGSGQLTHDCNIRVEAGARLRFSGAHLSGCGFSFNVFGGDGSALDIIRATITMGDQNYFLFDSIKDASVHVSQSTLAHCGESEHRDVVVTASIDGTGGDVRVEHSTLAADPDIGHAVIFAPTGTARARHNTLSGSVFVVGTFSGGTCTSKHNVPDAPCTVF